MIDNHVTAEGHNAEQNTTSQSDILSETQAAVTCTAHYGN